MSPNGAKCEAAADMQRVFSYIDDNRERFIGDLDEAIRIKSVSAWPDNRKDVVRMVHWAGERLKGLGVDVEYADIGMQTLPDGSRLALPPVLLGSLGGDPGKKTVLVYGHLDVQPADVSDGWDFEPFILTRRDGRLYGRGSTDDKGPALGWIHALEGYRACGIDVPLNIKFCFEGMEESGSEGLDELLLSERGKEFLKDVDFVCISDNFWLGTDRPCLTYGVRGICYFYVDVECCSKDLHSGVFGGTVHEALSDLIYLLNTLLDADGKITIDGINDDVAPLTEDERAMYGCLDFDVNEFMDDIGVAKLVTGKDKIKTLMARWRYPSLSLHGIHGAFAEPGSKTVIPRKVTGKFSVRIVPNQTTDKVEALVKSHLEKKWRARGSPNKFSVTMVKKGECWVSDVRHPNYEAARAACKTVFGVEPQYTRLGGSIPVTLTFQEATKKSVLHLPMGSSDDGAHSQNEKIDERNFVEGRKVLAAYLHELGKL